MPPPLVMFTAKASGPPDPWPAFDAGVECLDFNGTNEGVAKNANQNLNFANNWSIEIWFKAQNSWSGGNIIQIRPTGNNASRIDVQASAVAPGGVMRCNIYDTDTSPKKQYDFDLQGTKLSLGTWYHFVMTWDGTTWKGYMQGVEDTPTKGTDLACTMANDVRAIGHGSNRAVSASFFNGRIYSVAIWNVVLGAAAVTKLYNGGNARNRDLAQDSGAYTSSGNLQCWWVYGRTGGAEANMGINYGLANAPNPNVMDNAAFIDRADDLVADYPA